MNGYLGQVDQNLNEVENWVKKAADFYADKINILLVIIFDLF